MQIKCLGSCKKKIIWKKHHVEYLDKQLLQLKTI